MNQRKFDAVLFDWGGTLVTLDPSFPAMLEQGLREAGLQVDRERLIACLVRGDQWIQELNARGEWVGDQTYYQRVLAETGLDGDLPALARQVQAVIVRDRHWELDPEAPAVLAKLRELDCRLAVVSNWDRDLAHRVAKMGVTHYFEEIIASGRVGTAKPERAIFELGLRATGGRADRTLHVGDHPLADVRGAQAAGLSAVLLDRGERSHLTVPFDGSDGLPRITRLSEVLGLVVHS